MLVRFFGFQTYLPDYKGNLKKFLDDTCHKLNARWPEDREALEKTARSANSSIALTEKVFGEFAFRRYDRGHWETRFNRAIFDVMTFYFVDASVAKEPKQQCSQASGCGGGLSGVVHPGSHF
ncbi:hypothetical protein GCM10025868_26780 [Angustibacter aerolatus]|uniref:Uncharacterized protein n=1 Tax=Angustibacter aerolatus TaxID=1162965 RepID=A0ABQ6JGV1_9ACTN|nr:hypothetical protein GCM10025868_26780 [Angustibacter aerolatus]